MTRFLAISVIALLSSSFACGAYSPVPGHITTEWGENIDPARVWQEYPRPDMVRPDWECLNGLWEYAVKPVGEGKPATFEGEILVPFCVESALSGVGRSVGDRNYLWYRRSFDIPSGWKGKNIMLNFGAVDWKCDVWVNGINVGGHTGGYTPFSLDITDATRLRGNELLVRVYDPTDKGSQPRGKQVSNPGSIWYTPVTGIWQTVWLEPVAPVHISSLRITPDVDNHRLIVRADASGNTDGTTTTVDVYDKGRKVASAKSTCTGWPIEVDMPADMKLWSTTDPHLYDLRLTLERNGKKIDSVKSYAAMRKIGKRPDANGVVRFTLNDKAIFHYGPLDQGWWPDGLYTAPSYQAMKFDIDKTRELGYNMIRKHIKVEPALWYAYCDSVGILVWQDMPSADHSENEWDMTHYSRGKEKQRTAESDRYFRTEWEEIMDALHNHPSIAVWVPFNEGWGQYDTKEIAAWTKQHDGSRLVNAASGGNFFYGCGDVLDIHHYPQPVIYLASIDQANCIGEYGGIGCAVEGHLWAPDRNWGYIQFKNAQDVTNEYIKYADTLDSMADCLYTGAVYTQTTDVEIEVNGLMTYDRKVLKVDLPRIREANQRIINRHSAQ